jgi:hypothetical protein
MILPSLHELHAKLLADFEDDVVSQPSAGAPEELWVVSN